MGSEEKTVLPARPAENSLGIVGIAPLIRNLETGEPEPVPEHTLEQVLEQAQIASKQGDFLTALACWQRGIALCPEDPRLRVDYGHALLAAGMAPQAITVFMALRQEGFSSTPALCGEAEALAAIGDSAAALALLATRGLRAEDDPAIARLTARLHLEQNEGIAAAEILTAALRRHPEGLDLRLDLARTWIALGESEKAQALLRPFQATPALAATPEGEHAARLLTHLQTPAETLSPLYIQTLFDQYADRFDTELKGRLRYQVPELLREAINPFAKSMLPAIPDAAAGKTFSAPDPAQPAGLDILDLGCGTGLAGLAFHSLARSLVGVDLAPRMADQARQRGIYTDVLTGEAAATLRALGPERWDLILAADVLVYLGDLQPLLHAAHNSLRPGGILAATVETHSGTGFVLGPHRRFQHARHYIRECLAVTGLESLQITAITPRWESSAPVAGLLFLARRPESVNQNTIR